MSLILKKAMQGYFILFDEITDPRTKTWFLVAKPYQVLTILGIYLMFILKWGPQWMKNRQPYNIDKILILYNALQVLICLYLFIVSIVAGWGWKFKWICEPVDFSPTTEAINIAKIVYLYYIVKIIDLLDTVFFVLRRKLNQISFLHIYHHTGMVLLIWACITYLPGGHGTLIGVINSCVHVVMYSYYLMSVAFPSVKNTMWIKKLVTQLQIIQFFLCAVHMLNIVFRSDCEYPRWVAAVFLPQNIFMFILFIDFYIKAYIKKPTQKLQVQNNLTVNESAEYSIQENDKIETINNRINKLNNDINLLNKTNNINNNKSKIDNGVDNAFTDTKQDANVNAFHDINGKVYSTKSNYKIFSHEKEK